MFYYPENSYTQDWLKFESTFSENFNRTFLETMINEHVAILESDSLLFEEGKEKFTKRMGDFFKMIIAKIKEIWRKFIEKIDYLVKKDTAYIQKYKDALLSVELGDIIYKMPPYWESANKFDNITVPKFNKDSDEFRKDLEDLPRFRKKLLGKISIKNLGYKDDTVYSDRTKMVNGIKYYLSGGVGIREVKSPELKENLPGIIDYCLKYGSIRQKVSADFKNIELAANEAIKEVNSVQTVKSDGISQESGFLSEEKADELKAEKDKAKTDNKEEMQKNVKDSYKSKASTTNDAQTTNKEEDVKSPDVVNLYKSYITECQSVLGAKMEILEERYNTYMALIRSLVSKYIGDKSKSEAQGGDAVKEADNVKNFIKGIDKQKTEKKEKLAELNSKKTFFLDFLGKAKNKVEKAKVESAIAELDAKMKSIGKLK